MALQAFITLIRLKSMLNKLYPSVLTHQREELLRSSCFGEFLFDPEVLEMVITEHGKAQLDSSQVQMAKFLTSSASAVLSKASGSSFVGSGSRHPFSRPSFPTRGHGGRWGRGRGRFGYKNTPPTPIRKLMLNRQKMQRAVTLVLK